MDRMNLSIVNTVNSKFRSYLRWGIFIVLFIIANLISQHFKIEQSNETTIRLSIGLVFFAYLFLPVRHWIFLFVFQGVGTWLLDNHPYNQMIFISIAESLTSLGAAIFYKILTKNNEFHHWFHNNLNLPLSAMLGSLSGALIIAGFNSFRNTSTVHSNEWITWALSSMIAVILIPQLALHWKSFNIRASFLSAKTNFAELLFLIVSTIVVTNLIFSNQITFLNLAINFPYLLLPLIFWAAIRFHPLILSILLFVETFSILQYIHITIAPIVEAHQPYGYIINSIQIFIIFTIEFSYILAHIIHTRSEAQENIRKLNEGLEVRVNLRTSELKQALEALGQSEQQFREAFETSMHGMALVRLDGSFLRVNQALCDMLGYDQTRLGTSNFRKITFHEDYISERKKYRQLISGNIYYYQIEKRLLHRDKLIVWVMTSNRLITTSEGTPLHIVSQIVDITDRKQSENQLTKYSETLTILLREVNHRVKNNLSALISMLHMEEDKAEIGGNTEYIGLLRDLTSRIQGLSTVHSMLSANNWRPLELALLCGQIIQAVIHGLPSNQHVALKISPSAIQINSNQSHHLAIVLNELATNTVKYGMNPNHGEGSIDLQISQSNGRIHLQYKDNGPGYPEQMLLGDFSKVNIGIGLIRGIITQSLDGDFILRNDKGAVIEIWFQNELD